MAHRQRASPPGVANAIRAGRTPRLATRTSASTRIFHSCSAVSVQPAALEALAARGVCVSARLDRALPVQHHIEWLRLRLRFRALLFLDHQESLAVGGDVIRSTAAAEARVGEVSALE